jgi:PPK2 family polyphosphate:nucleotide phosphotransferase
MKLKLDLKEYRVRPGRKVNLNRWPTRVEPLYRSTKHYRELLAESRKELSQMQGVLYAHNRHAVLLIFQGMDTAGKGGAIRHVMSGINPQGCQVYSFKQPSDEELAHDYLWRSNKRLPERGRIGIFDRSYYEEVLIVRVYPEVLRKQRLPEDLVRPKRIWRERYRDMVRMEDYLYRNGTRVLKFFLHLSKEEQRQRFLARIDDPDKNWKLTRADLVVRKEWDAFQEAYEDCLEATASEHAPWYIVPADDKRNARLIVAQAVVHAMKQIPMAYPSANKAQRQELDRIRRALRKEGVT